MLTPPIMPIYFIYGFITSKRGFIKCPKNKYGNINNVC